ncbi:DUF695 domain-containing protein [Pedobacter sp. PWIIR3]
MGILKSIFGKKESVINSNEGFWNWFADNAKTFHAVVKKHKNIEEDFFNKLSPKLNELKEGYFFLTGMLKEGTAELVLTADGIVKNLVFVEELVAAAPEIPGWKFTAHKPETDIESFGVNMNGYKFNKDNISFYPEELPAYPDEISLVITHNDLTHENYKDMATGFYVFLDNYLGEVRVVTTIDNIGFIPKDEVTEKLIPIEKLKSYLIWREKEFKEKYEDVTIDTSEHEHSVMETKLNNGNPLFATINTELLNWDNKASHPWMLKFELPYDGSSNDGLPDPQTLQLLYAIEEDILLQLKDFEGYLNVGKETSDGVRTVYFACNEFRDSSKIAHQIVKKHRSNIEIVYEIFKDKYWQSLAHFRAFE